MKNPNGDKLYRCDPDKNKDCLSTHCYRNDGCCMCTTQKQYKINIFKRIKEWVKYGKSI